jgi:hypothetical protein
MDKPLFIPLKAEYFDAFAAGTKNIEYRKFGPHWNKDTCAQGRPVVLSRGYGKQQRLRGVVAKFSVADYCTVPEAHVIYRAPCLIACISIDLEEKNEDE